MTQNKKPKHFLVLKIIGFIGIIAAIVGIILTSTGFGNFENNNFITGGVLTCFGFFIGFSCLATGFAPEIAKFNTKTTRYIQEDNKEDLKDIASTSADISSDAVTKIAKSVKKGIKDTKYCKHCGAEIDADSKFCKTCGKEQ